MSYRDDSLVINFSIHKIVVLEDNINKHAGEQGTVKWVRTILQGCSQFHGEKMIRWSLAVLLGNLLYDECVFRGRFSR